MRNGRVARPWMECFPHLTKWTSRSSTFTISFSSCGKECIYLRHFFEYFLLDISAPSYYRFPPSNRLQVHTSQTFRPWFLNRCRLFHSLVGHRKSFIALSFHWCLSVDLHVNFGIICGWLEAVSLLIHAIAVKLMAKQVIAFCLSHTWQHVDRDVS